MTTDTYPILTPKHKLFAWWHLLVLALLVVLFSCQTARQLIDKAEKKDPAAVAEYTRDKYPCTDLLKNDTAIIYQDTTIYVDCPDTTSPGNLYLMRIDTLNQIVTKTIRVPVTIKLPGTVITKWYEDSAKLKLNALALTKSAERIADLEKQLVSMTASRAWYRKWFWIFVFIAGGLTFWTVRKLFL